MPVLLLALAACSEESASPTVPSPGHVTSAQPETTAPPTTPPEPTLADLPTGPAPRIGYVDDTTYVAPDGTRSPIPSGRNVGIAAIAPLGDGFVVQHDLYFEGYTGLDLVRDGRVVRSWSTTGRPVIGRHGEVAWCARPPVRRPRRTHRPRSGTRRRWADQHAPRRRVRDRRGAERTATLQRVRDVRQRHLAVDDLRPRSTRATVPDQGGRRPRRAAREGARRGSATSRRRCSTCPTR